MQINLICAGKISKSVFYEASQMYLKRLPEIKITEINQDTLMEQSKTIHPLINNLAQNLAFHQDGINLDSRDFANLIFKHSRWNMLIGGVFGLDNSVLEKCQVKISLGKAILPHLLARVCVLEQIYRAKCIFFNHPYHSN